MGALGAFPWAPLGTLCAPLSSFWEGQRVGRPTIIIIDNTIQIQHGTDTRDDNDNYNDNDSRRYHDNHNDHPTIRREF